MLCVLPEDAEIMTVIWILPFLMVSKAFEQNTEKAFAYKEKFTSVLLVLSL